MMDKKIDEQKIYFEDEKKKDSKVQRAIALFASISLWAIFLYLLQFFMTSLFLAFAAIFLYGQLFTSEAAAGTWELVIFASSVSVIAFLVLLIWAVWNKALYGGLDRRKPRPMPPDEEIAALYGHPLTDLQAARNAQFLRVCYTAERQFTIQPDKGNAPMEAAHHEISV